MHPLVSIALVLSTALLWVIFTVLMLASVNRRAIRQERKAARMRARPRAHADEAAKRGRARLHRLKLRRRHRAAAMQRK
jgi:hypothetical protein